MFLLSDKYDLCFTFLLKSSKNYDKKEKPFAMWKSSVDLPLITQYMYHLVLRTLTIFDIVEVCGQVDNNRSSLDKTQNDTWEKKCIDQI